MRTPGSSGSGVPVKRCAAAGMAVQGADQVAALARIRERPAYTELRERAKEIENLKSQF